MLLFEILVTVKWTPHISISHYRVASLAATPTTNCDPLRKCLPPYSIFAWAHSFAQFICARHTTETMEQKCLPSHTLAAARPICFHIHHLTSISKNVNHHFAFRVPFFRGSFRLTRETFRSLCHRSNVKVPLWIAWSLKASKFPNNFRFCPDCFQSNMFGFNFQSTQSIFSINYK